MNIQYVTNAAAKSGVGHQAEELARRLPKTGDVQLTRWHIEGEAGKLLKNRQTVEKISVWPGVFGSKSINWIRLGRKIPAAGGGMNRDRPSPAEAGYGLRRQDPRLFHLTNQTLSFLAKKLSPSVITVHDIIELLEPQDRKAYWVNRYLYSGIKRAQHLICVSEYTKRMVQEHLNIPPEKITVIYNGVGPEFHPLPQFEATVAYQELRRELRLPLPAKVVLYVGSDHPRKNVTTAVRAFAAALPQLDTPLVFIKVGAAGLSNGRTMLLEEINRLGIRDCVQFIDSVSTEQLNELYNLADVFLFPSRYEGFGLPVLQAMAAGAPVIVANSTSLPEVVGPSGLLHEPDDINALTHSLLKVLTVPSLAEDLRIKGQQRARQFSWERATHQTLQVYQKALGA